MSPDTRIAEMFGIEHPIVLAPMAGSAGPELAIEVCNSGGLGSLPCAGLSVEAIRKHASDVHKNSGKPFSLNFFCHSFKEHDVKVEKQWLDEFEPYCEELDITPSLGAESSNKVPFGEEHCQLIEDIRPAVASFHFGLPESKLVERVKAAGCRVISSANTVEEAIWLEQHGCDAVIAQGTEAGGHRGMFLSKTVAEQAGTMALVPQVVDAVSVPVIAAGGIGDGRGIAAAFALGASAVQIGTAYLFADESWANDFHRQKLAAAPDNGTVLTNVFSGRPARGFATRLTRELGPIHAQPMTFPMGYGVLSQFKVKAEADGSTEFSSYLSGQSAGLGQSQSAVRITQRLIAEAGERFLELSSRLQQPTTVCE
ncbi:MAG: nitronate monooxygenase [Pseudomonadota bacterium]